MNVAVAQIGDFGAATGTRTVTIPTTGSYTLTVATVNDNADEADGSVTATVTTGIGYEVSQTQGTAAVSVADDDVPEISIAAGDDVTEGGDAVFTITADPVPSAPLQVDVSVLSSGDFGAATGTQTVTVPTTGSVTFTVTTTDDGDDEPDGSITATIDNGNGYEVSQTQGSATVAVSDDDQPPPPPDAVPVIRITAGPAVTEGAAASFTVTASPPPAANLDVSVTVWQSGDWGAATGRRTVTVPTSGSYTFTVNTANDGNDEPNGSITAAITTGTGYTASNTAATATVAVSDDDEPPPPCTSTATVSDASAAEGDSAGLRFTVEIAPACDQAATMGYGIWDGTAARGQDYDYPYETITLQAGQTTHEIVVTVIDDNTTEGDETLTLFVYFPTGITTPSYFTYATGTITDND
ncbi:MAG: hypothetical protein OXI18_06540 [bacterium]|nr:hypothetical protein [bacterium]